MRLRPLAITAIGALALSLGWPSAAVAVAPSATISVDTTRLALGSVAHVTIEFTEAVSDFDYTDLAVQNGTLTALHPLGGGKTWVTILTPTSGVEESSNVITLDNTGVLDSSGIAGIGTIDSNNYEIDTLPPTANIMLNHTVIGAGQTMLATITTSEAVAGLSLDDFSAGGGMLVGLSGSGTIWTARFEAAANTESTANVITIRNERFTDAFGNSGVTGTTISNQYTVDTVSPTVFVSMSDTSLMAGETATVRFNYSEAVPGFDNSDIHIPNGTLSTVTSSDGGITWVATFTPTPDVREPINLIGLNFSGITDLAGNPVAFASGLPNYTIDTMRPSATVVVHRSSLTAGDTSPVTITFSEAVPDFNHNEDLTVENGTLSGVTSSDGGVSWGATLTPNGGVEDSSNLITLDNAGVVGVSGNPGTGTTESNNYAIDTLRPTAAVVVEDDALASGETSSVTITFSEAVSRFDLADLVISGGTLSGLSTSDGVTWIATLTPTRGANFDTGTISLSLTGVTDLLGNEGVGSVEANRFRVDHLPPTATIALDDTSLTAGQTSLVTITFSEAVTGFDNSDLAVANGTLSAAASSDGGTTWTATFTPTVETSEPRNVIVLDLAGVSDVAGNAGIDTVDSDTYSIDTVRPTATIVVADTSLTAGETSLVTVTFSEAVTGLDNADLTVLNGALGLPTTADGGTTWTAVLTPAAGDVAADYDITLDLAGVATASGSTGVGTAVSNSYTVAATPLTLIVTVSDTALGAGETSLVTFRFSRAVVGFSNANVTAANGSLSSVASTDGGVSFTATYTPNADTTALGNVISVNLDGVTDAAGTSAGSAVVTSNTFEVDTVTKTPPVVTPPVVTPPVVVPPVVTPPVVVPPVVTPPLVVPPLVTPPPAATPPAGATPPVAAPALAVTGLELGGILPVGVLLVLLGAGAYRARRRVTRA